MQLFLRLSDTSSNKVDLTSQYTSYVLKFTNAGIATLRKLYNCVCGEYSRRSLPLIPDESCHPFQAKPATDSTAKLPPWQPA